MIIDFKYDYNDIAYTKKDGLVLQVIVKSVEYFRYNLEEESKLYFVQSKKELFYRHEEDLYDTPEGL